jgi:hypothetical protein
MGEGAQRADEGAAVLNSINEIHIAAIRAIKLVASL